MKTKEQIEKELKVIRALLLHLYNDLDKITDKERYKQLNQEIFVYLMKEKTLLWVLSDSE